MFYSWADTSRWVNTDVTQRVLFLSIADHPTQLTMSCREHAPGLASVVSSTLVLLPGTVCLLIYMTLQTQIHSRTVLFDRAYWLVITVVWRSWTVRIAAPYKSCTVLYLYCLRCQIWLIVRLGGWETYFDKEIFCDLQVAWISNFACDSMSMPMYSFFRFFQQKIIKIQFFFA